MTDIRQLMRLCEREEISVETNELNYCESFSFMLDGSCFIVLDAKLPERLVKEHAAHEVGHCIKGAFYNRNAALDLISQHEYRADKWAIETLVPREELDKRNRGAQCRVIPQRKCQRDKDGDKDERFFAHAEGGAAE